MFARHVAIVKLLIASPQGGTAERMLTRTSKYGHTLLDRAIVLLVRASASTIMYIVLSVPHPDDDAMMQSEKQWPSVASRLPSFSLRCFEAVPPERMLTAAGEYGRTLLQQTLLCFLCVVAARR